MVWGGVVWCGLGGGRTALVAHTAHTTPAQTKPKLTPFPATKNTPTHTLTDKTIKLWKIREKMVREPAPHAGGAGGAAGAGGGGLSPIRRGFSGAMLSLIREEEQPAAIGAPASSSSAAFGSSGSAAALRIPQFRTTGSVVAASNKRCFANAHAYHVNSLSVNPDGETFISADDLRINLWHLEVNNQSFSEWLSVVVG